MNNRAMEKGISEIVGALTDPILVFPGGWGDSIPDWLKRAITMERLIMNMGVLKGESMTGTDAEACAYLMTVSLTQPIDYDWTDIYLHVAGKVYARWNKTEIPADIRVESLRNNQFQDLNRLKDWLYRRRTEIRLDRDRAARQQEKEATAAAKKDLQPALFDV